jgi:ArsR family transcriptional regulator
MNTLDDASTLLQLFADPTRVRLMSLLAQHELSVVDLVEITGLAQSRVSTHLGRLREASIVRDRREGTSALYSLAHPLPASAANVWAVVSKELRDPTLDGDLSRCAALLKAREDAAAWPDGLAGRMDRAYSPGRTWESLSRGLAGLLSLGDVLDLGSGDGAVAELLAPHARSYVCVDQSERLTLAAARRVASPSVRCLIGDMHQLALDEASFDVVLLFHVLTCTETPEKVIAESTRVLRPGGTLAILSIDEHESLDVARAYHHVVAGLSPRSIRSLLTAANLEITSCAVTSRERRPPHFQVVSAFATRPFDDASRPIRRTPRAPAKTFGHPPATPRKPVDERRPRPRSR